MRQIFAFMNAYSQGKSGADVIFIELYRRIQSYDLHVITSKLGKELCTQSNLTAEYHITSQEIRFRHPILTYVIRIMKSLFLSLPMQTGDIIYATSDALPDVLPIFLLKLRYGKRVSWIQKTFHLIPQNRPISFLVQQISFFLIRQSSDLILADNTPLRDTLLHRYGFPRAKLHIHYPGIVPLSSPRKRRSMDSLLRGNDTNIINTKIYDGLFIGRIHPSKGVFELMEIWKQVLEKGNKKLKLAIVGFGAEEMMKELIQAVHAFRLDKSIQLCFNVDDKEKYKIMQKSKLFLFPSHEEGFSLTIGEALSYGLPVIAYDLPCYDETYKLAIKTVKCFETSEFSQKIIALLSNKTQQQRMIQKGNTLIKRFDIRETVKKEKYYLEKLLSRV